MNKTISIGDEFLMKEETREAKMFKSKPRKNFASSDTLFKGVNIRKNKDRGL